MRDVYLLLQDVQESYQNGTTQTLILKKIKTDFRVAYVTNGTEWVNSSQSNVSIIQRQFVR